VCIAGPRYSRELVQCVESDRGTRTRKGIVEALPNIGRIIEH
jgi:hypothetical protein